MSTRNICFRGEIRKLSILLDWKKKKQHKNILYQDVCTADTECFVFSSQVLESFKIMDYSLLVGIHNLDEAAREKV